MLKTYWRRLQNHPGVPAAASISLFGLLAGFCREDGLWWIGLFASVFWVPVLITAITRPLPREEDA